MAPCEERENEVVASVGVIDSCDSLMWLDPAQPINITPAAVAAATTSEREKAGTVEYLVTGIISPFDGIRPD